MPIRSGTPSTLSTPSACNSKIGSVPAAESRRTPRASPRPAMIDWMAATERALP